MKMTHKEEYKLNHLLKIIKTEPIKMFCDFQNECNFLYDEIDIDINTINFINEYFKFYDIDVKYFYDEFRNTLRLILPRYYQMLKLEIDNDITKIYNNIKFRRLCTAKSDDAIQNKFNKNNKDKTYNETYENNDTYNDNNTNNNTKTSNSTNTVNSDSNEKIANKQNPLSNEANDFDELFNWDTSTEVNETNTENSDRTIANANETNNTTATINHTGNNDGARNYTENEINKAHEDLRKIAKGLKDDEEITTEINNLIVENINKIVDYLFKNNRSSDYLINNLKKCFVGIYYYN